MATDPNDPFASIGGGVRTAQGGWIPKGMDAGAAGVTASPEQPAPYGGGTPVAGAPAATTIPGQAAAASSYSAAPTTAPTVNTANQGTQDVFRNSLLDRATQDGKVDTNDPTFRGVADTYSASQERARRTATDMEGERMAAQGMGSSGLMDAERRMQTEKAAQGSASFESLLALSELQNERAEIASALEGLGNTISGDQARALTEKLAQMDAAIKQQSLSQTGQLGNADIGLRRDLGTGALNIDAMRLLLGNQQQNSRLGFDIGNANADHNARALQMLLNG